MEEVLAALSRTAEKKQKARGSKLFSAGRPLESIYYLEEGYAKIFRLDGNRRETLYSIVGPSGICGISLENGNSHLHYSASMITDGVVRVIPPNNLAKLCTEEPRAWRLLAEREARQRASMEKRIEIFSIPDVTRRLIAVIPYLIEECRFPREANGSYVVPLRQSELAGFVGASRETTSAKLNVLAKRNLLITLRGRVVVPDLEALIRA